MGKNKTSRTEIQTRKSCRLEVVDLQRIMCILYLYYMRHSLLTNVIGGLGRIIVGNHAKHV